MVYATKFFKVIKENTVIAVGTNLTFARYVESGDRIHICDAFNGQYIVTERGYFHDTWMNPVNSKANIEYEMAEVKQISEDEYTVLTKALTANDEVLDEVVEQITTKEIKLEPSEQITIGFVRKNKLEELSKACNEAIEYGFDLVLLDGTIHHFSMTLQDQLNLATMDSLIKAGEKDIPYHADGELYRYFKVDDAKAIIQMANKWKTYNVAYYNSLKNWINSIQDTVTIGQIRYGSSIPTEYCSTVLQNLSR